MSVLRWWFVTSPQWGWQDVAQSGHSAAGLAVFAVGALTYAVLNLVVAGGVIAVLGRAFRRRPVSGR